MGPDPDKTFCEVMVAISTRRQGYNVWKNPWWYVLHKRPAFLYIMSCIPDAQQRHLMHMHILTLPDIGGNLTASFLYDPTRSILCDFKPTGNTELSLASLAALVRVGLGVYIFDLRLHAPF